MNKEIVNTILHGRAEEKLKEIASNSIDCIVSDPPYGMSESQTSLRFHEFYGEVMG
ncbi:MAG: hypothetical protein V3U54_12835 [Thermodesulfobacteriota bacterium]